VERDIIWTKLAGWPEDKLFPVVDLQRLYLMHPSSSDLFKGIFLKSRALHSLPTLSCTMTMIPRNNARPKSNEGFPTCS